jgi:hypothetical protein
MLINKKLRDEEQDEYSKTPSCFSFLNYMLILINVSCIVNYYIDSGRLKNILKLKKSVFKFCGLTRKRDL